MRRVVVTGLGMVSPLGNTVEESWQGVKEGRSGIGPITYFDTEGYDCKIAGQLKDFDVSKWIDKKVLSAEFAERQRPFRNFFFVFLSAEYVRGLRTRAFGIILIKSGLS